MSPDDLRDRLLAEEIDTDLDALMRRTRAAIEADAGVRGRLVRLPTPARTGLVLAVAGTVWAATLILAPRPDLWTTDAVRLGGVVAASILAALGALALAMRPAWRPAADDRLALAALVGAVGVPLGLLLLPEAQPPVHVDPAARLQAAVGCFAFGSAATAAVILTWRTLERRSWSGPLRWAVAAAAGAAVGMTTLQLHCPVTQLDHLVLGHGSVGLVWTLGGVLAVWIRDRTGR